MKKENNWIDKEIDISTFYDKLSDSVKELIIEAEEAEKNDMDMAFYEICDSIEIQSKLLVPDVISFKEWDLLCSKYYPCTD